MTNENSMTRQQAAAIAKDLVEGGINTKHITRLTAESHGIPLESVRRIRRTVLRMGKEMAFSMVDAIENGWEDANLNLKG